MPNIELRTRADTTTGHRRHIATAGLSQEPFDVYAFLCSAAKKDPRRRNGVLSPLLSNVDLDDLREQLVTHGRAETLTRDGRLDLAEANFDGWTMADIKATRVDMGRAVFKRAVLDGAILDNARLSDADFDGASIQETSLRKSDLRGSRLGRAAVGDVNRPLSYRDSNDGPKIAYTVNARSAHLEGANLDGASLDGADLSNAHLNGTRLTNARVRDCDFSEAVLVGTDFSRSKVVHNILRSPTAYLAKTSGAHCWSNTYLPKLSPSDFFGMHAYARLDSTLGREEASFREMPKEMRNDYLRSLALMAAVTITTSVAAAHVMDSARMGAVMGALGVIGGANLARYTMVHEFTHEVVHRAVEKVVEYASDACDRVADLSRWLGGKAGLVADTRSASRTRNAFKPDVLDKAVCFDVAQGVTVIMSRTRDFDDVLSLAGLDKDRLSNGQDKIMVTRNIGGYYPKETAPTRVTLHADGTSTAIWHDKDGLMVLAARYGMDGCAISVLDQDSQDWIKPNHALNPFLSQRRAAFAELRDCIVRSCVPHKGVVNVASISPTGDIRVSSKSRGKPAGIDAGMESYGELVDIIDANHANVAVKPEYRSVIEDIETNIVVQPAARRA